MKENCYGRVVSRNGDINCPPISCNLIALLYKNIPQSIPDINYEVISVIDKTEQYMNEHLWGIRGGHVFLAYKLYRCSSLIIFLKLKQ